MLAVAFAALLGAPSPAAAAPAPTPSPGRVFTGLLRAGGNLGGARFRPGVLELRRETLRWTDARDPSRNLFLPLARIAAHALICRNGPKGEVCDVWSFRTSDGETERFRDPDGESGVCARAAELFRAVLEAAPGAAAKAQPPGPAR